MSGNAGYYQGTESRRDAHGWCGAQHGTFPWRDYAQKVALNDAFEGELVVRHGR